MGHRIFFMALALCAGLGRPEGSAVSDIADARTAAESNLKEKAGLDYSKASLASFAAGQAKSFKACRDSVKAPDTSRFEIFFKLSRRGTIKTSLLSPVTNVGECLLHESAKAAFPPPPGPNHWILIRSSDLP